MAFAENFAEFFNTSDFAVSATYTPTVGSPVIVEGIFDNEYFAVDLSEVSVSGSQPKFTYESSKISSPKLGDSMSISAINYKIVEIQPDGTGITTILLEKQ